jgi:hypothetical protein
MQNDTLISLIIKTSISDDGVFSKIMDDILQYELNVPEIPPLIEMAIAYTRRSCSAGMYTQGIHNKNDHAVYQDMWLDSIKSTGKANSKSFQTAAASQSFELIKSYDNKLNKKLISTITTTVEHGDLVSIADMGIQIPVEEAISYFQESANNMDEKNIGQQTINVNTGIDNENIFNITNSLLDNRPPLKSTPMPIFKSKRLAEIFIEIESLMNSEDFQGAITANEAMISMSIAQAAALREMDELIAEGCEIMNVTPNQFFQIVKDKKSESESDDLFFDDETPF